MEPEKAAVVGLCLLFLILSFVFSYVPPNGWFVGFLCHILTGLVAIGAYAKYYD